MLVIWYYTKNTKSLLFLLIIELYFVTLSAVCKCIYIYTETFANNPLPYWEQNKLLYIKFFIMNKQFYFSSEYVAPEVEVISAVVEHGFSASLPGVTIDPWESEDDSLEF